MIIGKRKNVSVSLQSVLAVDKSAEDFGGFGEKSLNKGKYFLLLWVG